MAETETRYTFDRVVRMVLSAATIVGVLLLLRYLSDVLLPFAAAVILAYLLNPLVTLLEKRTKRRGLAVALTLGGLGVVGMILLVIVVPLMVGQISHFQHALLKLRDDLATSMTVSPAPRPQPATAPAGDGQPTDDTPGEKSTLGIGELTEAWGEYRANAEKLSRSKRLARLRERVEGTGVGSLIDQAIAFTGSDEFNALLIDTAKRLAAGGWTLVTFVLNLILGLTGLIIVLLYLVFLLMDYPEYSRDWQAFLPPKYRETIVEFLDQFYVALRRYFRGQSVVAMSVGVLFAIGFSIIGLPMAVPFGLFVGLLNMVPYLQTVGLVPGLLLAGVRAIEGDSSFAMSVILVLLVFGLVQLIQDAVLTPTLMGKATGLRPVAILLGVFIWGKLLGVLGLLLAIPLTCLGIAYYRRFVLLHSPEATKITEDS
ncbi:MAG: AI-2E family transporter [Phycisphaerae bacterium]